MPKQLDPAILEMALIGYAEQRREIENAIAAIRSQMGKRSTPITTDGAKAKRKLSVAARKRIASAQKKRWKEFHQQKAEAQTATAAPKRKLSPARKAALVANLAKARAAKAEKKAAAAAG
jgi:hypothetical protein